MTSTSTWIPLEGNPDTFNKWSHAAGLTRLHMWEDIFGLDEELLALVPGKVEAVVLLFPITAEFEHKRKEEDAKFEAKGAAAVDPTLIFIKQTIPNACGTIGILHAIVNARVSTVPGKPLHQFIAKCQNISPVERAKLLDDHLFTEIHREAASSGQSAIPSSDNLDTNLHFTCFVQSADPAARDAEIASPTRRLIELDGRRAGPIDRGSCTDLLRDAARVVKEKYVAASGSMTFSMFALVTADH